MSEPLTLARIGELDFRLVYYMEVTAPGGMGNVGGVVVEVLAGSELIRYETHFDADEAAWEAAREKMKAHRALFDYHYGGYGNDAFVKKDAGIVVDEPSSRFKFEHDGRSYNFSSSVPGVFSMVAAAMRRAR